MPTFGMDGFNRPANQGVSRRRVNQYRQPQASSQQAPAPQPAMSMPAYAQASGAGAAQPIAAPADTATRPVAQPAAATGNRVVEVGPFAMPTQVRDAPDYLARSVRTGRTQRETQAARQSKEQARQARSMSGLAPNVRAAHESLASLNAARDRGEVVDHNAIVAAQDRILEEERKNVRDRQAMPQEQQDGLAYEEAAASGRLGSGPQTREGYVAQLRGNREQAAAALAARQAVLSKYDRPAGMSDAAFEYLVDQQESGERVWDRPSYSVWRELSSRPAFANDTGAYGNAISPGLQSIMSNDMDSYRQDTRHARNVSAGDRARLDQAAGQYLPERHFDWRPWENRLTRRQNPTDALIARLG